MLLYQLEVVVALSRQQLYALYVQDAVVSDVCKLWLEGNLVILKSPKVII
jgi:hypothetical protein